MAEPAFLPVASDLVIQFNFVRNEWFRRANINAYLPNMKKSYQQYTTNPVNLLINRVVTYLLI